MKTNGFLGIDVSKGYADFMLLDSERNVLEGNFQLDDNKEGRKKLIELIKGWLSNGLLEIYCGVESTGGYEDNWYSLLHNLSYTLNVRVARLNPKGVKSIGEAILTRTINDAVSARNIALYLVSFPEKIVYSSEHSEVNSSFKEERQALAFQRMLIKQKVQLNNQLEKLLYRHFSEVLVYCRHGIPNWLLQLLVKYPSAKQVVRSGEKMLIKIKGISAEKAAAIVKKARCSDQQVSLFIKEVISQTAKEIIHKKMIIDNQTKRLNSRYKDHSDVKLISSITGIGISSAVKVILEIESVSRFEKAKKLCSFFGIHPSYKQSGDGSWKAKLSKKGRSDLRAVLYMCSLTAIRSDDNLKQLYSRFRGKGMNHYQAICVVMHKMLRIIYGVLKTQKAYDPKIDIQNKEIAQQKRQEVKAKTWQKLQERKRKFQRYKEAETDAPISRQAAQKRKKQEMSQASLQDAYTGSNPAKTKLQKI
jgi:transposase